MVPSPTPDKAPLSHTFTHTQSKYKEDWYPVGSTQKNCHPDEKVSGRHDPKHIKTKFSDTQDIRRDKQTTSCYSTVFKSRGVSRTNPGFICLLLFSRLHQRTAGGHVVVPRQAINFLKTFPPRSTEVAMWLVIMSLVWQLIQSRLLVSKLKCVEAVVTRHVTISRGGLILILNESAADRLSPVLSFVVNVAVVVGFVR